MIKMECIKQSESYTCGPAALCTILKAKGIKTDEKELMELSGTDETGTSLYGLLTASASKGLDARGLRAPIGNLKALDLVFLQIGDSFHYSVIEEITEEYVKLLDPALERIQFSLKYFKEIYANAILRIE